MPNDKDKYRIMGHVYDSLATIYGGKSYHQCKTAMINKDLIKPGDKILFAGCGYGQDAIQAAEIGADVTVVDISATMVKKFNQTLMKYENKCGNKNLKIRVIHSDILEFHEYKKYDMVVANFFLNVFAEDGMNTILKHLLTLGKPPAVDTDGNNNNNNDNNNDSNTDNNGNGFKFVIGDFAYPHGGKGHQFLQNSYWYMAVAGFHFVTGQTWHPIYNHIELLKSNGLELRKHQHFKRLGVNHYESVLAVKV